MARATGISRRAITEGAEAAEARTTQTVLSGIWRKGADGSE